MSDGWDRIPLDEAEETLVGILHRLTRWPESYRQSDSHALRKIGDQMADQALELRARGSRSRYLERLAALVLEDFGVEHLPIEILRQVFEPVGGIVPE